MSKSSDSIEESAQEPLRFEPEPAENAQPWVEKLDDGYPKPEPLIGAEEEAPVERTAGGVGRRLVLGLLALSLIFGAAAIESLASGEDFGAHLAILAALALVSLATTPWAMAAALRQAGE